MSAIVTGGQGNAGGLLPQGRLGFIDQTLRDAIASRTKDYAHVALHAIHLMTDYEFENVARLPMDDGRTQAGSKNLLALAHYALFLETLMRDSWLVATDTDVIPQESATELLVSAIRANLQYARTIQDLQRVMGYNAIGRTDLLPGDRSAWTLTWRALLRRGEIPAKPERAADNFTYLLMTAQNWLSDGEPWTQDRDSELEDLAGMLFSGAASTPDIASDVVAEQETWVQSAYPGLYNNFGPGIAELLEGWGITPSSAVTVTGPLV